MSDVTSEHVRALQSELWAEDSGPDNSGFRGRFAQTVACFRTAAPVQIKIRGGAETPPLLNPHQAGLGLESMTISPLYETNTIRKRTT